MAEQYAVVSSGDDIVVSSGNAIILGGADVTIQSLGRSSILNSVTSTQQGAHSIAPAFSLTGRGQSNQLGAVTSAQRGQSTLLIDEDGLLHVVVGYGQNVVVSDGDPVLIGLEQIQVGCRGYSAIGVATISTIDIGRSSILEGATSSQVGYSKVGYTAITFRERGYSRVFGPFTRTQRGKSGIRNTTNPVRRGKSSIYVACTPKKLGYSRILGSMSIKDRGLTRIANDDVAGWVMYIGEGAMPNFQASPAGFSTTLPFNVSVDPPESGQKVLNVVVRKRNKYGLESQNSLPELIVIDSSGVLVKEDVPAPVPIGAFPQDGEIVRVTASYPTVDIDKNPANEWLIWIRGTVPNPDTDTPTLVQAVSGDTLIASLNPYSSGTWYVAVALRRTSDSFVSPAIQMILEVPAAPLAPSFVPAGYQV